MNHYTKAPSAVSPAADGGGDGVKRGSSPSLALAVGDNTVTVRVTSADLSDTRVYTFTVTRMSFELNAELGGLSVAVNGAHGEGDGASTVVPLVPAFAPIFSTYSLRVGYATSVVTLLPTSEELGATIGVASAVGIGAAHTGWLTQLLLNGLLPLGTACFLSIVVSFRAPVLLLALAVMTLWAIA